MCLTCKFHDDHNDAEPADRAHHVSDEQLLSLYRSMVLIRRCEEHLARRTSAA